MIERRCRYCEQIFRPSTYQPVNRSAAGRPHASALVEAHSRIPFLEFAQSQSFETFVRLSCTPWGLWLEMRERSRTTNWPNRGRTPWPAGPPAHNAECRRPPRPIWLSPPGLQSDGGLGKGKVERAIRKTVFENGLSSGAKPMWSAGIGHKELQGRFSGS